MCTKRLSTRASVVHRQHGQLSMRCTMRRSNVRKPSGHTWSSMQRYTGHCHYIARTMPHACGGAWPQAFLRMPHDTCLTAPIAACKAPRYTYIRHPCYFLALPQALGSCLVTWFGQPRLKCATLRQWRKIGFCHLRTYPCMMMCVIRF